MAQKKKNGQLKEEIAQKLKDYDKLQAMMKADIDKYKASDEELLLHICLNNDLQGTNNTSNEGGFPTYNPQSTGKGKSAPFSPNAVIMDIIDVEINHLDFNDIDITTKSYGVQEREDINPIVCKPLPDIPLDNGMAGKKPFSPNSYDLDTTRNELTTADLDDMDLFNGIDMVAGDNDIQDINDIRIIMNDMNELFPVIPHDTATLGNKPCLKKIDEAKTIQNLLTSDDRSNDDPINGIDIMEEQFDAFTLSPPSPFKN